jgi:DNA-binding transcriptional MerR regulator
VNSVSDRSHLSIGEVLSLLQDDFPDVTISKIRFLESQGLLDPERTPSGYRKFYEPDIERLRWILRQQRENFLPLKVIKDRLAAGEVDFNEDLVDGPTSPGPAPAPAMPADDDRGDRPHHDEGRGAETYPRVASAPVSGASPAVPRSAPVPSMGSAPPVALPAPAHPPTAAPAAVSRADAAALLQEAPTPRLGNGRSAAPPTESAASASAAANALVASVGPVAPEVTPLFDTGETAVSMTLEELMGATGLSARAIGELERFGMLASRTLGTTSYYDENALLVARLAARFGSHGIEARHLRMYRVSAEREAGLFEQLLMPMMRRRNAQARRETAELINELATLGDGLRTAMLRQLLRDYLDGS